MHRIGSHSRSLAFRVSERHPPIERPAGPIAHAAAPAKDPAGRSCRPTAGGPAPGKFVLRRRAQSPRNSRRHWRRLPAGCSPRRSNDVQLLLYAENWSDPCSQTGVGGLDCTVVVPPPGAAIRNAYARGSHRPFDRRGSPGPGTSGEKRAVARAICPGRSVTGADVSASGLGPRTCVGSGLLRRPSSWTRGRPVRTQRLPERFLSRNEYTTLPAPALPRTTRNVPESCRPVQKDPPEAVWPAPAPGKHRQQHHGNDHAPHAAVNPRGAT